MCWYLSIANNTVFCTLKARMTKAEHTLELLVHVPLVTHCVFYHPQLKN
jgi:hypothetical protein